MKALLLILAVAACGPSTRNNEGTPDAPGTLPPVCEDGATQPCYEGPTGTAAIGTCHAGTQTCAGGQWGACAGQQLPVDEDCSDGLDNNCNGRADEDEDLDGDGYSTCQHDCCDSTTQCSDPALVNPGAYDALGNTVDDDCDGMVDNTVAQCDDVGPAPKIRPDTMDAMDFARAIDLCQTTTEAEKKWGVIDAKLTLANGSGTPAARSHAVRPHFGTNVLPKKGAGLALLSTGAAAAPSDSSPAYDAWEEAASNATSSPFPSDFLAANGGSLPNAPGCPEPSGTMANDPVMLTLRVRVPSNAKSFKFNSNFFSSEFPEWTCSPYNDFFVVLLDSTFAGTPANPADKNLAIYTKNNMNYPVGVNLAWNNTGLFTQCTNGQVGCSGDTGTQNITTCTGSNDLVGTGFDDAAGLFGACDNNSKVGGATGWLETSGNVVGGEIITLRIAIWDTSDHALDSAAVIDGFEWSVDAANPGTVIGRTAP